MFGSSGGDGGYGVQQHGYQTRSRGRSRHEAQEERLVEGDLFGSTKRQSFRSTEPPTGLPPRASYYDGTSNVGGNAFANAAGAGAGGGPVGYGQTPRVAQPSPFARGRTPTNSFFAAAGTGTSAGAGGFNGTAPGSSYAAPTPTNAFFSAASGDGGAGTAPRSGYGGPRYSQVSPATGPRPQQEPSPQGFGPGVGSTGEVALVPVETSGNGRGVSMDDDDDDDDMPTRSLADDPDVPLDGGLGTAEGIRFRRGGAGGGGGAGVGRASAGGGGVVGGFDNAEPDTERTTWVVVWGVPPGKGNEVLTRFLHFGDVEEQRGHPGSNWLYLKYATRLQAEKALAAGHGSRLTDTVMLGVQRVPDDETWQALRAGRIPSLSAAQPVLSRATPGRGSRGDAMDVDDTDLLNAPPRRPRGDKSVCSKLRAMFGFF